MRLFKLAPETLLAGLLAGIGQIHGAEAKLETATLSNGIHIAVIEIPGSTNVSLYTVREAGDYAEAGVRGAGEWMGGNPASPGRSKQWGASSAVHSRAVRSIDRVFAFAATRSESA